MMPLNYFKLACDLWYLLGVVWLFGLLTAKPDARTQSLSSRILEIGLGSLAFSLVFTNYFRSGWTGLPFAPTSAITGAVGLFVVLIGVSFAIWARLQLGGNWSAAVSVKEGHTLIRQGPYTIVRHPIYSGLLLSLLGVAVIAGQVRGLLGVGVFFLALWLKSSMEERFMLEEFGAEYRSYQQRVKALVPYLF
jgi:protein-S-isoprenylcysteine O-methyltransferase Ste14